MERSKTPLFTARLLGRDDRDTFRSLRLRSLEVCSVFMPLIEDHSDKLPLEIEKSWPLETWTAFLEDNDERQFFGLFADRELIGIGQLKRIDAAIAELKSAFIATEYRGRGLWKLLLEVRIRHAERMNYRAVRIGYRIGNTSMERALAGTAFVEIFREQMKNKYQDGEYGQRVVLSMELPVRPVAAP